MKKLLSLHIPEEHACFDSHFPGNPIVPGALLLAWVRQVLQSSTGKTYTGINQAKFLEPVIPGLELQIEYEEKEERNKTYLILTDGSLTYMSAVYEY